MSNSRYSVSSSPGGSSYQAPPLYDTSTSTADSFGSASSQRLRRSYEPLTASNLRKAAASSPVNAHTNPPNNPFASSKRAYPAPSSEPGLAMMDDRPRRISASASDVGVGSVSEQIRRYNRRKEASMDRVMQAREAFHDNSSAEPSTPPRNALDQSFDSSVAPSIQDLKRQLWNDQEVLRGSPRQTHRPTVRTRSLSPAIRQTQSSGSLDSKFNSKYYTAALAATSRGYDGDSPQRQTISRDRRDSKETYCSAPYDEGGRKPHKEESTPPPSRPPTTYQAIPPIRRTSNASADTNKPQPEVVAVAATSKPPTFQPPTANPSPKATARGRSPSRLIQQRVREFSRDKKSQPALPRKPVTKPRSTSQPRPRRDSESSFERLAREFNGELVQIHQTLEQQESTQHPMDEPPSLAIVPPSPVGTAESRPVPQAPPAPQRKDQARSPVPPLHKAARQSPVPTKASKPPSVRSASPRSYSSNQRPSPKASPKSSSQVTLPVAPPRATPSPQSVPSATPNVNLPSLSTPNSKREVATPQNRPPTPQTPPNKESTSKTSQSKSAEPAVSVAIDQPNVADLVAKLVAVNRSNPEEALAQIDSILRQAGKTGTSTSLAVLDSLKAQQENDSDDDDTSVSSITNPSFMPSKHSPGGTHALTAGRPRPTQLHNYMPTNLQPGFIPALGGSTPRYTPSPPNPFNPFGMADEQAFKVSVNEQQHDPFGKINDYVADQDALAAKIKVWDDMSRGGADTEEKKLDSPVRVLPTSPRPDARRPHPWDDEIPPRLEKLDVRDTSMENAVGIEAAMTNRQTINNMSHDEDIPVSEENSYTHRVSTPRSSPAKEEEFMQRNRNEIPVPRGTIPIQGNHEATKANPFYDAYGVAMESKPRITPQQQQHTRKISSAFDRAYASMPGARFYPVSANSPSAEQPAPLLERHSSILSDPEPHSTKGPVDLDESISSAQGSRPTRMPPPALPHWPSDGYVEKDDEERGAIEVSLLPDDLNFSTSHESSEPSGDGGKPKKRGFLRAFMRREKKRNPKSKTQEGNQSVSMASSGVHSMPAKVPTNGAQTGNPSPHVRSMPFPPGVDIQEMPPPRGRFGRNPPGRSRSASLERFQRSSSMAQKFGRVMRLYDQD